MCKNPDFYLMCSQIQPDNQLRIKFSIHWYDKNLGSCNKGRKETTKSNKCLIGHNFQMSNQKNDRSLNSEVNSLSNDIIKTAVH